jgi:tRNA pseudouridine38-40 synthase
MRRRIAIGIEYQGSAYCGWQIQSGQASVQSALQSALSRVADEPIALICAGRTDAGVHARGQVAHFETSAVRRSYAWLLGTNAYLAPDISLRWVCPVPDHFHARFSALARSYRYLILNRPTRSALAAARALVVYPPLDLELMQSGAAALVGEHDFSAFRSAECQARSPVRQLRALRLRRSGEWITIDITANAFLHHMVRNIVGLLVAIGLRRVAPERAQIQLESRQRSLGEAMAAATGLYLWHVDYAPQFGLPELGPDADSAMIEPAVWGGF